MLGVCCQIKTLVAKASDAALSRFFGGEDVDWLSLAEACEGDAERSSNEGVSFEDGGLDPDDQEPVLTLTDLEEGEKRLPPPTSSMKMGCPKIPKVGIGVNEPGTGRGTGRIKPEVA